MTDKKRQAKHGEEDRALASQFRHLIRRSLSEGSQAALVGLSRRQMRRLVFLLTGKECHD